MIKILLVVVIILVCNVYADKDLPLPPLFVKDVGEFSDQPSGLTYCSSTNRLYMNCDICDFIAEMDTTGRFLEELEFDSSYSDIEAMACNDVDKYLYIAEEGDRRVIAFRLDEFNGNGNKKELIEVYDFSVVTGDSTSSRSGLEGMTVDSNTGRIYVANEKGPAMIIFLEENRKSTRLNSSHEIPSRMPSSA
eukprot:TRINITY_DN18357_c1_g1_i1.p2 TRINITY_DN18357_c1_g1~~TRINITY_DN18357_c1_g1_i1.p2  ORF type:complete len:215 (-),score=31.60 TRINITY_DN18357_c1_g1_i1:9-584(-)